MKPPTLRDVAAACGVSSGAVSQALNNSGRLAESTRERIRRAADRLGYRPDVHAAMLARRVRARSEGVHLALITASEGSLTLPHDVQIADFRTQAEAAGLHLTLHHVARIDAWPAVARMLYHRGVEGVFLPAIAMFNQVPPETIAPFSLVVLGQGGALPGYHAVHHEIFKSLQDVLRELTDRGYRRILTTLDVHQSRLPDDEERLGALETFRARHGNRCPVLSPKPFTRTRAGLLAEIARRRADAVVGFTDYEWKLLRNGGVEVPRDIGFAALHVLDPRISGSLLPLTQITTASLDLMLTLVRRHDRGRSDFAIQLRVGKPWNEGQTVRPRSTPDGAPAAR